MTDRDRVQWLLRLAHLHEVEADPREHRDHSYGPEFTKYHYPGPTLATIMACGAERREALRQAREIGVTGADTRRVSTWFAGGTASERRARERAA